MAQKRTILHDWHIENNARMIEFAGWDMPVCYSSITEEHAAVRTRAGLFDLSHMGRLRISGNDAVGFLQYITTNDVESLPVGGVQYSLLCNKQGGVIDDITLYRADDYFMMVVNASNSDIVLSWLNQHRVQFGEVRVEDISMSLGMTALQGPRAESILQKVVDEDISSIKYYHFIFSHIENVRVVLSRTGYTGEDGFELYLSSVSIPNLWNRLLETGSDEEVVPVGLGARDTLRLEACFPLYGNELNNFTTPLEAGLGKFVKLEKDDFLGKKALLHSTTTEFARRLVAIEMLGKAVPRKDCPVAIEETPLGKITSGAFSPTLQKGIAMGYLPHYKSMPGTNVDVIIRDAPHPAEIVKKPFYNRRNNK